jgi:hypothetical protein
VGLRAPPLPAVNGTDNWFWKFNKENKIEDLIELEIDGISYDQ